MMDQGLQTVPTVHVAAGQRLPQLRKGPIPIGCRRIQGGDRPADGGRSIQTGVDIAGHTCQIGQDGRNDAGNDLGAGIVAQGAFQLGHVAECIERMCRQRGVLVWSDGLGNLVIGRGAIGRPVVSLVRGENVLEASADRDFTGRFSEIVVKATREGIDGMSAEDVAQIEARVQDAAVKRHRPKIIVPETHGEPVSLKDRADWEYRVSVGRSRKVTTKVHGWRHQGGLWRPGQTVDFSDDWLGVSGGWLVGNVGLAKDGGGSTTTLTLYPPGAFDRLAEPEAQ